MEREIFILLPLFDLKSGRLSGEISQAFLKKKNQQERKRLYRYLCLWSVSLSPYPYMYILKEIGSHECGTSESQTHRMETQS